MARAVYVTCYYKPASSEVRRRDCGQGVPPKQFALGEANMTELPPQLRQVRDFFFKQALALSPERTYLHQPELIKNQTIFRLEDLRKHLNNPFLDLDFVQIIDKAHLVELGESEMGPLEAELVMHAGDVLFLRSGTPHQVETVGDYSLHLSFDLCDRAAGIETVFDLLLKRYDRDSLRPYGAASEVLEKVASLGRTEDFRREIEALQQQHKAGYEEFRRSVAASRVSFFDPLIAAEETKTEQR